MFRGRPRTHQQRYDTFVLGGGVRTLRDEPPQPVPLSWRWLPTTDVGTQVNAPQRVGSQESVIDALCQGVFVEGVPEILVGIGCVLAKGRRCETKLRCGLEVVEYLSP